MKFLSAEWRKLAIINYTINPQILEKFLPQGVQVDFWKGKCYVSVVAFMFQNTRILGVSVPFHRNFEEVNLRFYVKKWEDDIWKRGVVFIKEFVPKKALSMVANTFYNEHYETCEMKHHIHEGQYLAVKYHWNNKVANFIKITADHHRNSMIEDSEFEFITEHYFGFTKSGITTTEYEVRHPKWDFYQIKNYDVKIDFESNYGQDFSVLNGVSPASVMLAEGSEIEVHTKKYLKTA